MKFISFIRMIHVGPVRKTTIPSGSSAGLLWEIRITRSGRLIIQTNLETVKSPTYFFRKSFDLDTSSVGVQFPHAASIAASFQTVPSVRIVHRPLFCGCFLHERLHVFHIKSCHSCHPRISCQKARLCSCELILQ